MNPGNSLESQRTMAARKRLLQMHFESGVGHIGGNLSCLDILLALYKGMAFPSWRIALNGTTCQ